MTAGSKEMPRHLSRLKLEITMSSLSFACTKMLNGIVDVPTAHAPKITEPHKDLKNNIHTDS